MRFPSPNPPLRFFGRHHGPVLRGAALTLALFAFIATPASSAPWGGQETVDDGVLIVKNPTDPSDGHVVVELQEEWRLGGDTDNEDEFFGVITQVRTDPDGNVYLLDSQLNEVKIFSADGEFIRSIGREGEGPGEFRRPSDLFLMNDGTVGVLQLAPGRIVLLTPEGDPAGEHPIPEVAGGGFRILRSVNYSNGHMVLVSSENSFEENVFKQTHKLLMVDRDGAITHELYSAASTLNTGIAVFYEREWDGFYNRWGVAPDGRIMTVRDFGKYEVTLWKPDGSIDRVVTRNVEPRKRSAAEVKRLENIFAAFTANVPNSSADVEPVDSHVIALYVRDDGSLWVLSARGSRDNPEGSIGTFDVFDREGHFKRQVTLMGQGDSLDDGYFFVGDRVYVVTDFLAALAAAQGGEIESEGEEEATPMEVICYRIDTDKVGL